MIARSVSSEAIQTCFLRLDCFVELVIGLRVRADPLARSDDSGNWRLKSRIVPLATSLFQMNRTTTAPIAAVMKPAPCSGP